MLPESNKKLLICALNEYGVSEIPGRNHNQRVLEYFKESGNSWVKDDETAWCAAFMSFVAKQANVARSLRLNARSWLEVGTEILKPKLGDIAILWRISKTSPYGHVGIFIGETQETIFLLGGNQNNKVSIEEYPKYRVLAYRQLTEKIIN